jgi:hypothetical protein
MAKDREEARRNTRMRFEQWARNPSCEANTFSAVHNVRMADVARSIGLEPTFGQSPFAIARGQDFESFLFRQGGARLIEQLVESDVVPEGGCDFVDFRLRMNGGTKLHSLDDAIEATADLLRSLDQGPDRALPLLVAGTTVRIPRGVMLPEANLIIDALVVRRDLDPVTLIVGEIKAYPDRGGYTDEAELAGARAQAGLYVHALEVVSEELGLSDGIRVAGEGFLVLTRPGSNWPSIRPHEELRYQALRAARGFELLERAALQLPDFIGNDDEPLDERAVTTITRSAHAYSEACLSFCDLAVACHDEALARGDAIVLGDDIRRFVGGIELRRALALLDGAVPSDATEEDFVRRVRETEQVMAP